MIVRLFIDEGIESDYFEYEASLEYMPDVGEVLYFDGIEYTVSAREIYFHDRLSEVSAISKISYNLFLDRVEDKWKVLNPKLLKIKGYSYVIRYLFSR